MSVPFVFADLDHVVPAVVAIASALALVCVAVSGALILDQLVPGEPTESTPRPAQDTDLDTDADTDPCAAADPIFGGPC